MPILYLLWFACFGSFGWATRYHFQNRGRYTRGMKWTLGLGTVFALLQAVAIGVRPFSSPAAVLYSLSFGLFWWTIRTTRHRGLGACYESIVPGAIVTDGPYRWVRHPFYVSYLLAWMAGATVYTPLAVSLPVMGGLYWAAAADEERRMLRGPSGEKYAVYRRCTGRFFISCSGIRMRKREA